MSADPTPSSGQPLDGIAPAASSEAQTVAAAPAPTAAPKPEVQRAKRTILTLGTLAYVAYVGWCGFLLMTLPSPTGDLQELVRIGSMSALVGAAAFVVIGLFLLQRIARADVTIATRQRSLVKMVLILIPGIAISAAVPFMIVREPALTLDMTPSRSQDLVAPVAVTIDAQRATQTLNKLGYRVIQYLWDTNNDNKVDEKTVEPRLTKVFTSVGTSVVSVTIRLENNDTRRLSKRIVIPKAVFSLAPEEPTVDKSIRFDVTELVSDPGQIKEVQWDFDGDAVADVTVDKPVADHIYFKTGTYLVTAVIQLQNGTQQTYQRSIDVGDPKPLPFPVTITTEPKNLLGPAPFGVIFKIDTQEPLKEVTWDFGDGKTDKGPSLTRIGHSFDSPGTYSVVTQIRSASGGQTAELVTLVRATPTLQISDLSFEGTPDVRNATITGEVPLSIELTPKTSLPLIKFNWEVQEATSSDITGTTVRAIYRREGTYTLTLLAENADGKTMRMPITVNVQPPGAEPAIAMKPEGGVAPLRVVFDASDTFIPPGQQIAGFRWLFGDERQAREGELGAARVEHTYEEPGEYTVSLTVVLSSGKTFNAKRIIVVRRPTLAACLTASRVNVQVGKGVEFDSACSTGTLQSILWDVRSTEQQNVVIAQSPLPKYVHVFDAVGTYEVKLTVKDASGYEDTKSVTVTVTP